MTEAIAPILQATELLNLYQTAGLVLIDASSGKHARANYEKSHLAGALFVDLEIQMADIKEDAANGGRHPLPDVKQFAETLASLGISAESHVVVYDEKNGANAAARFWWMLKAVGHEKVQVLNGGFMEAEKIGFPTNSDIETPNRVEPYKIDTWKLPLADIVEVEAVAQDKNHLVIDVRSPVRYRGEMEPIDLIAGHIPGAINVPYELNLDAEGFLLPAAALRDQYQKILGQTPAENIIVHCGSGVTACHTLLALAYAGLEIPKLYVGSWSEWSRNHKKIGTIKNAS